MQMSYLDNYKHDRKWSESQQMQIRKFIINIEIIQVRGKMLIFLFLIYLQFIACQQQSEDCDIYRNNNKCYRCPEGTQSFQGYCIQKIKGCLQHDYQNPFKCLKCQQGSNLNRKGKCQSTSDISNTVDLPFDIDISMEFGRFRPMNFEDEVSVALFRQLEETIDNIFRGMYTGVSTSYIYQSIITKNKRYIRLTSQQQSGCLDLIYEVIHFEDYIDKKQLVYKKYWRVDNDYIGIFDRSDQLLNRFIDAKPLYLKMLSLVCVFRKTNQEQYIFFLFSPQHHIYKIKLRKSAIRDFLYQQQQQNQNTLSSIPQTTQIEDTQTLSQDFIIYSMIIRNKYWNYFQNFTIVNFTKYFLSRSNQPNNQYAINYYNVVIRNNWKGKQQYVYAKYTVKSYNDKILKLKSFTKNLNKSQVSFSGACQVQEIQNLTQMEKLTFYRNSTDNLNQSMFNAIFNIIRCSTMENVFNNSEYMIKDFFTASLNDQQFFYFTFDNIESYFFQKGVRNFVVKLDKKLYKMSLYVKYDSFSRQKNQQLKIQFNLVHQLDEIQPKDQKDRQKRKQILNERKKRQKINWNKKRGSQKILSKQFSQRKQLVKAFKNDQMYHLNSRIRRYEVNDVIYQTLTGLGIHFQYIEIQVQFLPRPAYTEYQFPSYKTIIFRFIHQDKSYIPIGYFVTKNDNYTEIMVEQHNFKQKILSYPYRVGCDALMQIIKRKNYIKAFAEWHLIKYYQINNNPHRFILITRLYLAQNIQKYVYYDVQVIFNKNYKPKITPKGDNSTTENNISIKTNNTLSTADQNIGKNTTNNSSIVQNKTIQDNKLQNNISLTNQTTIPVNKDNNTVQNNTINNSKVQNITTILLIKDNNTVQNNTTKNNSTVIIQNKTTFNNTISIQNNTTINKTTQNYTLNINIKLKQDNITANITNTTTTNAATTTTTTTTTTNTTTATNNSNGDLEILDYKQPVVQQQLQNNTYIINQLQMGYVDQIVSAGVDIFSIPMLVQYYKFIMGTPQFVPTEQQLEDATVKDKKIYVGYPISKDYLTINLIDNLNTSCQEQVNHIYLNDTSYSISTVPLDIVFSDPRLIRIRQSVQLIQRNLSNYTLLYMKRLPLTYENGMIIPEVSYRNQSRNKFQWVRMFNTSLLQFQMVYLKKIDRRQVQALKIISGYRWKTGQIIFNKPQQLKLQYGNYTIHYASHQQQIIKSNSTYPSNVMKNNLQVNYDQYINKRISLYFNGLVPISVELINPYQCRARYQDIVRVFQAISGDTIMSNKVKSISVHKNSNNPHLVIYYNQYSYNFSLNNSNKFFLPHLKAQPKSSHISVSDSLRELLKKQVAEYLCIDIQYIGRFNIGSKLSQLGLYDIITVEFTIITQSGWPIFKQEIINRFTFEVISEKRQYLNLKQYPLLKQKKRAMRSYGLCQQINLNLTQMIKDQPLLIPISYQSPFYDSVVKQRLDLQKLLYQKNYSVRCKKQSFFNNFLLNMTDRMKQQLDKVYQKELQMNRRKFQQMKQLSNQNKSQQQWKIQLQKQNEKIIKTQIHRSKRKHEVVIMYEKENMITKLIFPRKGFYNRGVSYSNLNFIGIKEHIHPYLNQVIKLFETKGSKPTLQPISQTSLVYWKWKKYSQYLYLIELFYDLTGDFLVRIQIIVRKSRQSKHEIIYPIIEKLVIVQLEFIKQRQDQNKQQVRNRIKNKIDYITSLNSFQVAEFSLINRYGMYFNQKSQIIDVKSTEKGNQIYFDVRYRTASGIFDVYLGYNKVNNSGRVIFFNVGRNQAYTNTPLNCKQLDGLNQCKRCQEGYRLQQKTCYKQLQGCFKQFNGICLQCHIQYMMTASYKCQ